MTEKDAVILVRPSKHDEALAYAYALTEPVIVEAERVGLNTTRIEHDDANPSNIMTKINEVNPELVYCVGHGCANVYTAEYLEDVFWNKPGCQQHPHNDSNLDVLKGRFIRLLSCLCGRGLGKSIVQAGAKGFSGYTITWSWIIDENVNPDQDKFATSFFTCDNKMMIKLFAGKTPEEAHKAMINTYNEQINYWRSWLQERTDATPYERARALLCVEFLEIDRGGAVLILPGEPQQKVKMGGLMVPGIMLGLGGLVKVLTNK